MNPPILSPNQLNLIKNADFEKVHNWMNELYPAIKNNSKLNKLFNYLNDCLKDKA